MEIITANSVTVPPEVKEFILAQAVAPSPEIPGSVVKDLSILGTIITLACNYGYQLALDDTCRNFKRFDDYA
jgi:hypothetical protein